MSNPLQEQIQYKNISGKSWKQNLESHIASFTACSHRIYNSCQSNFAQLKQLIDNI